MTANVRINDRLKKSYLTKIRVGHRPFAEPEEIAPASGLLASMAAILG